MTGDFDAFIEEVRTWPRFIEAANRDAIWHAHLHDIERGFECFGRADHPAAIHVSDRLSEVITDRALSLKQRLLGVVDVFSQFKYGTFGRN